VKDELVQPGEVSLGAITLVLGLIGWRLLVVLTVGIAFVYLLFGFLFYLYAHSAFISWLRGNAVLLSQAQLPDLRRALRGLIAQAAATSTGRGRSDHGGGSSPSPRRPSKVSR